MKLICAASLVVALLSFVGQIVVDHLQGSRTGVSANMFVIEKDGQLFVTGRGGGPVDARPKTIISREQYDEYLAYHRASGVLGSASVLLCLTAAGAFVVLRKRRGQPVAR